MMPITTLPARTANSIGATKSDKRPPTGASHEWKAAEINETLDRMVEIFTEVGLSDGSTAGSVWEAIGGSSTLRVRWNGTDLSQLLTTAGEPTNETGIFGTFAQQLGGSNATPSDLVNTDQIEVIADTGGSVVISFTGTTSSIADLIAEVNGQLNGAGVEAVMRVHPTNGGRVAIASATCGNGSTLQLVDTVPGTLAKIGLTAGTATPGANGSITISASTVPGGTIPALRIQAPGMGSFARASWLFSQTFAAPHRLRMRGTFVPTGTLQQNAIVGFEFNADPATFTAHQLAFGPNLLDSSSPYVSFIAGQAFSGSPLNITASSAGFYYDVSGEILATNLNAGLPEFYMRGRLVPFVPVVNTILACGELLGGASVPGTYTSEWDDATCDHVGIGISTGPTPMWNAIDIYIPVLEFERIA